MMRFFLDGSALAKRYVTEPGTPILDALFDKVSTDRITVLNIGFAEIASVLVRRKNAGLLSHASLAQALIHLGQEIIHAPSIHKVQTINALVVSSLIHIQNHSINATDAIVLHAALRLAQHLRGRGDDITFVASDQRLLRAAQAEGLVTFNPENQDVKALALLMGP